jgi:hypothetical protein
MLTGFTLGTIVEWTVIESMAKLSTGRGSTEAESNATIVIVGKGSRVAGFKEEWSILAISLTVADFVEPESTTAGSRMPGSTATVFLVAGITITGSILARSMTERNLEVCPMAAGSKAVESLLEGSIGTEPTESGSIEPGSIVAGSKEAGSMEGTRSMKAGSMEAGSMEAVSMEAGSMEAWSLEVGSMKAGSIEAGSVEAGSIEVW